MSPLSCAEVEEQIELYALHECEPAAGEAVAGHLARCRSCARAYQEARQMLGLLDLHLRQDKALARLKQRLAAEGRRGTTLRLPRAAVRPALALAALLLLTLGLSWWAEPARRTAPPSGDGWIVATLSPRAGEIKAPKVEILHAMAPDVPARGGPEEVVARFTPAAFPRKMDKGDLPPPPGVHLALRLHNTSDREWVLLLEKGRYDLGIDLRGPGVVRVPAAGPALEPFPPPGKVRVPPGGACVLTVQRLSEVRAGRVSYVYWTKPGLYELTVRLRVLVESASGGPPAPLTVTTPLLTLRVKAGP